TKGWQNFTRKDNGLNQYRMWSPYSIINYDDDIGNGWGSPGAANGVLMQDGWVTASYNALNQPIAVWSPAYSGTPNYTWFGYDPLGRCVKRWVGPYRPESYPDYGANPATYLYYDGWNLIQEGPQSWNAEKSYVHGARVDEIVASIRWGWDVAYHHYDASGHCTLLTNSAGNIREQYDYDAFGYPYFYDAAGNNVGYSLFANRFLFTGREWLSDLKLYDYRNRMYQRELGRFMQPDPKHFAAGDYNLYRYCHNDPVNKSDPTGLFWRFSDPTLKRQFEAARREFERRNPTLAAKVFGPIDRDKIHSVTVTRSSSYGRDRDQFKAYASGNASFSWNPNAAAAFAGGVQSPATQALHEAAHAARYLTDPQGYINDKRAGDGPMGRPGLFHGHGRTSGVPRPRGRSCPKHEWRKPTE
ncbi:MAG: hypothetical protein QOI07_2056, partial [Verrucomicrobiota bacterium]